MNDQRSALCRAMSLAGCEIKEIEVKQDDSRHHLKSKKFNLDNYKLPVGQPFGGWKVCGEPETRENIHKAKRAWIPVEHKCGNIKLVRYHDLKSIDSVSCTGCGDSKIRKKRWHIKGSEFSALRLAAEYFGVNESTIRRWVYGRNDTTAVSPPRDDCWVS